MLLAIVGAPLGGFLADKWLKRRKNARSLFPALSSLVTSVALLAAFTILQGHVQYAISYSERSGKSANLKSSVFESGSS